MELHNTIKNLRTKQGIKQKNMADKLCMAPSTYSKLESGSTMMPYDKLVSIAAILQVPVYTIIQEDGGLFVNSVYDKFSLMLHLAYHTLSYQQFSAVPYEQLNFEQLSQLSAKGFASQESYENTPLGGRIYDVGPKKVFAQMIEQLGMQVLFEEKLVRDENWLKMWHEYQQSLNTNSSEPSFDLDEHEYFIVYMISLTMPDGETQMVQLAERDFPQGVNELGALDHLIKQTGADKGDILGVTEEGYAPFGEIVKCL